MDTPRLKLDTLVRLRWLAVAGQTMAVLVVDLWLGFRMPIGLCLAVIALSAWLNLFLKVRYPSSLRLRGSTAALLLAYDLIQLTALLYLTGGLQNPFAILVLVPVMISATALAPRLTVVLGALAMASVSLLAVLHLPLPWHTAEPITLPILYVSGVWLSLVSAVLFMGIYAFRVAEESRQLADALAATELVLAREQHLSALDGLAAAAAHELGTPLATIALVAKELERELPADSPHADDVALLRSQSQRCRDILGKLTSLSTQTDKLLDRLPISHLVAEVVEPHQGAGVEIEVKVGGDGPEPVGRRNPAVLYGVGNLLENAVDFADGKVEITASWDAATLSVVIADDGPGFAADVIDHIGEPYVTTRGRNDDEDHEAGGLGLGFFIAKTLLERSQARVELSNRPNPAHGAVVRIVWPRSAMDGAAQGGPVRDGSLHEGSAQDAAMARSDGPDGRSQPSAAVFHPE